LKKSTKKASKKPKPKADAAKKKEKTGRKTKKKPDAVETKEEGTIKRNFAPGNEPDTTTNKVHWEGSLGSDYSMKLHTWSANSNSYFNIRKGKGVGTNIPVQLYWRLVKAMECMRQDNPSIILPAPVE